MTTNQNVQQEAITEIAAMTYADPATLLVDRNVRNNPRLDKDFLASIRDLGVLVPIVAVRTTDGALRVRYGHRRTAAAVEAGHAYVPVVVVADEATDDAAEVERLVTQYAENEHRSGLTTAERVEVFTQLSAFGVSAAQIAKRTKTGRKEVDAALTVAGSELARAAATRYDFLTLEQAAVVAEFDDDNEAAKALILAANRGGFDHLAQRLRDDRAEAFEFARVADALAADGVTVVERPSYGSAVALLAHLVDGDGNDLTDEGHRSCPGHAAYLAWEWVDEDEDDESQQVAAHYVCTDPNAYGHRSRWASSAQTAVKADLADETEAKAERRRVLANNKAWRSAEVVRRAWLARFCDRKTPPKGAPRFVASWLMRAERPVVRAINQASSQAAELFGTSLELDDATPDKRAEVLALAMALASYEAGTGVWSWRSPDPVTGRYLRYLEANGYELSDVERLACGEDDEQ